MPTKSHHQFLLDRQAAARDLDSPGSVEEQLLDRQALAWESNQPLSVEQLLAQAGCDGLGPVDVEVRRSLILGEIFLRRERGETGSLTDEIRSRFPDDADELWAEAAGIDSFSPAVPLRPLGTASTNPRPLAADIATPGSPPDRPPTQAPAIADYAVLRQIGQGGFGRVWLAQNLIDGQYVALKQLEQHSGIEIDGLRALRSCDQRIPGLLRVLHVGQGPGFIYYTMRLADPLTGSTQPIEWETYQPHTLANHMRGGGQLSLPDVLKLARNLLTSLAALHDHGWIHADIKPDNILQLDGEWLFGDFGLMTLSETSAGARGTRAYWPPEGVANRSTDDLYALAKSLKAVGGQATADPLCAQPPLAAKDEWSEILEQQRLEHEWEAFLTKALHPQLHQRFANARQMNDALPWQVPDYRLVRHIGSGDSAEVWLAQSRHDGHLLALKRFHPGCASQHSGAVPGQHQFAQVPHLLRFQQRGQIDGVDYETLPLADSIAGDLNSTEVVRYRPWTLASQIAETGRLTTSDTLRLAHTLLEALERIHACGGHHTRLIPERIFRVSGAWLLHADDLAPGPESPPAPAPPTVAQSSFPFTPHPHSPPKDLHALAQILRDAWRGTNRVRRPARFSLAAVTPWRAESRLEQLLTRALHPDATRRFASVAAMRQAIRQPALAHSWSLAAVIATFLIAVGVAVAAWNPTRPERSLMDLVADFRAAIVTNDQRQRLIADRLNKDGRLSHGDASEWRQLRDELALIQDAHAYGLPPVIEPSRLFASIYDARLLYRLPYHLTDEQLLEQLQQENVPFRARHENVIGELHQAIRWYENQIQEINNLTVNLPLHRAFARIDLTRNRRNLILRLSSALSQPDHDFTAEEIQSCQQEIAILLLVARKEIIGTRSSLFQLFVGEREDPMGAQKLRRVSATFRKAELLQYQLQIDQIIEVESRESPDNALAELQNLDHSLTAQITWLDRWRPQSDFVASSTPSFLRALYRLELARSLAVHSRLERRLGHERDATTRGRRVDALIRQAEAIMRDVEDSNQQQEFHLVALETHKQHALY